MFSDTAYNTTDHITYPPHTRTHTLLTTQTHNSFIIFKKNIKNFALFSNNI